MNQEKNTKLSRLKDFFRDLVAENNIPYRLVEIVDKKGIKHAIFRVNGSRLTFKKLVNEVITDDSIMSGLGYQDVRSLSFYAMFEGMRYQYEVDCIGMDTEGKGYTCIRDLKNKKTLKIPLDHLREYKDILRLTKGEAGLT